MTFATGYAIYNAAQDVINQLKERAAKTWNVSPEEVVFQQGVMSCTSNGHESIDLRGLAAKFAQTGGPVIGRAQVNPTGVGPSFATHLVDVEVDPETGKVDILPLYRLPGCRKSRAPKLR